MVLAAQPLRGIRSQGDSVQASLSAFHNSSDLGTTFTPSGTVIRAPERIYGIEPAIDAQPIDRWQLGVTLSLLGGEIDTNEDGDCQRPPAQVRMACPSTSPQPPVDRSAIG